MKDENLLKIFNDIYKDIDGFNLSISERRKLNLDDKTLVYGEIKPQTFLDLLKKANISQNDVFYDLGSGTGKAVVLAMLFFNIKKSVGIDILHSLVEAANEVKNKFIEKGFDNFKNVFFIRDDFLNFDFSEATLIFAHSTCLNDDQIKKLEEKCLLLKPGSRIILVTKTFSSSNFEIIYKGETEFSWGVGTVSIYLKN
jgi:SAM-dependent methyltransferase